MKKQEKKEKVEKEEQQKAAKEKIILNERVQLRLECEKMEEGKVESEASHSKNDESHVKEHAYGVEKQDTEKEERRNDPREVTVPYYV